MVEERIMAYQKDDYRRVGDIAPIDNITLDYDVSYQKFPDTQRYNMIKKFIREYPLIETDEDGPHGWIRKSSSGKVHIKINLVEPIPMLEHVILRAMLSDDRERLRLDLCRLYYRSEINILFAKKFVRGKTRYATEWIKFR